MDNPAMPRVLDRRGASVLAVGVLDVTCRETCVIKLGFASSDPEVIGNPPDQRQPKGREIAENVVRAPRLR